MFILTVWYRGGGHPDGGRRCVVNPDVVLDAAMMGVCAHMRRAAIRSSAVTRWCAKAFVARALSGQACWFVTAQLTGVTYRRYSKKSACKKQVLNQGFASVWGESHPLRQAV
jgi:hypothetical protein